MGLAGFDGWDERVRRGDLRGLNDLLHKLERSSDPEAPARCMALRTSWHRVDPDRSPAPDLRDLRALPRDGGVIDHMAALSAARLAALSAVRFDFGGARAAIEEGRGRGEAPLELDVADALLRVLAEPPSEAIISTLGALFEKARSKNDAFATVDSMSLWALSLLRFGRHEEAREKARRASRMARTEAFPLHEYLAHLVLARVRRLDGMPHRSLRILRSLAEVVPRHFRGWLSWELLFSGSEVESLTDLAGRRLETAIGRVVACLSAAREGKRKDFDAHASWIGAELPGLSLLWEDAQPLLEAIDPRLPANSLSSASVSAWARGGPALPPRGLSALAAAVSDSSTEPSLCAVTIDFEDPPRRVLATGVPLLPEDVLRLSPVGLAERINTALVALALGGGMGEAELFEEIYGFVYRPKVHGGAFRTLLHRVRAHVSDLADVERHGALYSLRVLRPFVTPELRCREVMVERLLVAVARAKKTSAREAAKQLGAPLRTVQRALRSLVDDGTCNRGRAGNEVYYTIEDTTFSEPTRYR